MDRLKRVAARHWRAQEERRIRKVVSEETAPVTTRSEQDFEVLQNVYDSPPEYGYDRFSTWSRAVGRVSRLFEDIPELRGVENLSVLDSSCGDGMLGVLLKSYGALPFLQDLEDWRDERASQLGFQASDLCGGAFDLGEDGFDLACSYNAFEHLPDPRLAATRLLDVLRPGGYLYLEFGPLYASPHGLHAYRSLRMPYPQWLFSEEFVSEKISTLGISDLGREMGELQPLNKWRLADFENLWGKLPCEVIGRKLGYKEEFLPIVLEYPEAFRGRGLTYDDLRVYSISVVLKKALD
jgi:SAM-dependent methyltransferase